MTASIHYLHQPDADPFALARHVVRLGSYAPETVAMALDILALSSDPRDMAAFRWHREIAPQLGDMFQIEPQTLEARTKSQLRFILLAAAVVGGVFGGALMERWMTIINAGGM